MNKVEPPSELFENCILSAGSIVIDCELCGRTHFGDGSGDYEQGELESLQRKAKENPDKYIQHFDDNMVSYGYIIGKQAVIGCPCNELGKYERFILSHKMLIMEFLAKYAEDKYRDAKAVRDAAWAARAAMEQIGVEIAKREQPVRKFDLEEAPAK